MTTYKVCERYRDEITTIKDHTVSRLVPHFVELTLSSCIPQDETFLGSGEAPLLDTQGTLVEQQRGTDRTCTDPLVSATQGRPSVDHAPLPQLMPVLCLLDNGAKLP